MNNSVKITSLKIETVLFNDSNLSSYSSVMLEYDNSGFHEGFRLVGDQNSDLIDMIPFKMGTALLGYLNEDIIFSFNKNAVIFSDICSELDKEEIEKIVKFHMLNRGPSRASFSNIDGNNILSFNSDLSVHYEKGEIKEAYIFKTIVDAFKFICLELLKRRTPICKCENCDKYFIPQTRKYEKYCSNPIDLKKPDGRTCKDVGYENSLNEVNKSYRKAYKTKNAYKQRSLNAGNDKSIEAKFKSWVQLANSLKIKAEESTISPNEFREFLSLSINDALKKELEL